MTTTNKELLDACKAMRDVMMRVPSRAFAELSSDQTIAWNRALDAAIDAIRASEGDGE